MGISSTGTISLGAVHRVKPYVLGLGEILKLSGYYEFVKTYLGILILKGSLAAFGFVKWNGAS